MKSLGEKKKVTPMRLFSLSLEMDVFLKSESLKKKTKPQASEMRFLNIWHKVLIGGKT